MCAYYSTVGDFPSFRYLIFADELYGVGAWDVSDALRLAAEFVGVGAGPDLLVSVDLDELVVFK